MFTIKDKKTFEAVVTFLLNPNLRSTHSYLYLPDSDTFTEDSIKAYTVYVNAVLEYIENEHNNKEPKE